MGLFDSVWVQCECGASVEFQSKAGQCILRDYTPDNVPRALAEDLSGKMKTCRSCGVAVEYPALSIYKDVVDRLVDDLKVMGVWRYVNESEEELKMRWRTLIGE